MYDITFDDDIVENSPVKTAPTEDFTTSSPGSDQKRIMPKERRAKVECREMLDSVYEDIVHSTALNKVLDEVEATLLRINPENLWQSLFPDSIVALITAVRETCSKNCELIDEDEEDKLYGIYYMWSVKQK